MFRIHHNSGSGKVKKKLKNDGIAEEKTKTGEERKKVGLRKLVNERRKIGHLP